jgi:4-hydroxy-tetrahydrodipicolinate reductase
MSYRVIQWSTGELGRKAIAGIVGHPDLELAGTWVFSEDKDGRDVGEVCGRAPLGVRTTRDADALLAMDADCIVYMAGWTWMADPMATVDDVARMLRAGKNVVQVSWPSLVYPQALGQGIHDKLQEACLAGGSSFYTAGIDPGFGSIGLALAALSVTQEVKSIRTYEILNYSTWDHPEMITWFGFGQSDPAQCGLFAPGLTTGIFASTLTLLADAMGVKIDEFVEAHTFIHADEPFDTTAVHIPAGTISGARFEVRGMVGGEPRLVIEHVTRLRDDDYPEVGMRGGGYRAEVVGEPCIKLDLELSSPNGDGAYAAYVACAMAAVNAIPQVCDAAPGVLTYLDLLPHPSKNVYGTRP